MSTKIDKGDMDVGNVVSAVAQNIFAHPEQATLKLVAWAYSCIRAGVVVIMVQLLPIQDHVRGTEGGRPMRGTTRFAVESLLLFLLSGGLFVAVVVVARQLFADDKLPYFIIGYIAAIHSILVHWIWKRLRGEKVAAE